MQGGILYGAAVLAARRVVPPGMTLADGHLQFVAPADRSPLTVDARALRLGRRTSFVEVRLTTDEHLAATGAFTFHRIVDATG